MSGPLDNPDTIVAIATPPGKGGIGILRLSGPRAPEVLGKVFQGRESAAQFESHRLYPGRLIHPGTEEVLDQGMGVWMRAPRSYTGEDVVELHAHGGPLLLNRLLEVLLDLGTRLADPGEFTRRAFLNGKLDLLQAEAVAEVIHAQSEAALKNARMQLEGRLSGKIRAMRERILLLLSRVEAAIDFPEEDIEILSANSSLSEIKAIQEELTQWLEQFQVGRLIREGVRLVLVGRPNVGKSSLLNRLLEEERAIVHSQPGTTRDVLEGTMTLSGVHFQVFDTAGIREGKEEVEKEGIRRSERAAALADLTLLVWDSSCPPGEGDREIAKKLKGRVVVVGNKSDLRGRGEGPRWGEFETILGGASVRVSALTGEGLGELKRVILKEAGIGSLGPGAHPYLNNARHRNALHGALLALERAGNALAGGLPAECIAADLRETCQSLGGILGDISTEDILEKIFSDFCIGK